MKKLFIIAAVSLLAQGISAQTIDRSHKPKPGPAPIITVGDPVIYKLANGITVLVVENHKLPKVAASYSIDAGPITEGAKAGVVGLMGSMLNEGTTTKTKAQFDEAVDQLGADVSAGAYGGSASALTRYFPEAFALMAESIRKPAFPAESFEKLKSQTITGLKSNEKSAKAISARVVNALAYGKNHPYGEFETEASITGITLDDVKAAYKKYITPSRGYLTFVGDIKPEAAKALAEKAFGDWKGTALTLPVLTKVVNPAKTEVDIINVSNAVQSEITVVNLIDLPMSSPDYFPILLANQILGGGSESRLFDNLREKHGFTYGAYSSTGSGRFQSKFSANAAVRNEKVDSAVVEFLREINTIRTAKVTADELQNAKNLFNGSFALGLENPARTAGFASNILINNLPKDFYRTYLQKINAVTTDDILRVTKKYFNHDNTRIVIVGKSDAFAAGLTKAGFKTQVYDNYANAVKATETAAVPTAAPAEIIKNYIKAIGGEEAIKKITSLQQNGEMEMQGQKLMVTIKNMAPNLSSMEISMGGQTAMKQVYNGKTGYAMQMGQKAELTGDDLAEKKDDKGYGGQLYYATDGTKIEAAGTAKVGTADAFKLNITSPSGKKKTEYYDTKSGLLLKDESTTTKGGAEISQSTEYSNYKKVGDVLFPFTLTQSVATPQGSQEFSVVIKDIKINPPLKTEDFN
ncbi:insulinase family protein [Pedobacter sp. ISL-68]|uniref:M16 family metallopeptidase n=1 Tax=unclassified Pedobacter TaxID=2628915 RepID=UPI001BEC06DA|nr:MULTISPECIES: pitrilysin family protein [unclassified Pedobacter]MBT2562919.1 insulinase family protein [Pedobacter sp. ISL-64]MBT2593524.1 insulinase family protein [Pedobacter sp. ISL-68]